MRTLLPALLLFTLACGSSTLDVTQESPSPDIAPISVEAYWTPSDVQAALDDGEVLRLAAAQELRGVYVYMTTTGRVDVEYAVEGATGELGAYQPLSPELSEEIHWSAQIVLPTPARAIWLRFAEGSESVEYLSARHFAQIPADGILFAHHDTPDESDESGDLEALYESQGQFLTRGQALARSGRWQAPGPVVQAGKSQGGRYNSARRCSPNGNLTPGARTLADYLRGRFPGVTHVGGYNCRKVRGGNSLSIHATGRAIDVHIAPATGGEDGADNDLGDPMANWLIQNAGAIGIQAIVWDRSIWSISRKNEGVRHYCTNCWSRGRHPHNDHLHIELNEEGANQRTPWFRDRGVATEPSAGSGPSQPPASHETVTCNSMTLGRRVPAGECVQMSYVKYGGRCNWAVCNNSGNWVQASANTCPGQTHSNAACGSTNQPTMTPTPTPEPAGASCHSRTLGRHVESGACVQVDYSSRTCARCGWFKCVDGGWQCTDQGACGGDAHPHGNCSDPGTQPNELRVRLEWSEKTDLDLFVREPSGEILSYRTNNASPNDGQFYNDESCRSQSCSGIPTPYHEDAVWGERASRVTAGTYAFWVENYNGKAASNAKVRVTRTDGSGQVTFDQTFDLSVPGQRRAKLPEQSVSIR